MSDSDFVFLESEDGFTFSIPRKVACASNILKSMLDEEGEPWHFPGFATSSSRYSCVLRIDEQLVQDPVPVSWAFVRGCTRNRGRNGSC